MEARRQQVYELFMRGMPLSRIAQELGVHKSQITRDLKHIRRQWQETRLEDLNTLKDEELARLAKIQHDAWLAWERSCKDAETMEVTGTSQGGKGEPAKVKKVTKGQAGDSRYLAIILDCVKQRCRLLGLEAPKKLDHTSGGQPFYKAYFFDPDNPPNPENQRPASA
jgi:hypothetical protein